MKNRSASDDERALFEATLGGTKPLKGRAPPRTKTEKPKAAAPAAPKPPSLPPPQPPPLPPSRSGPTGLDGRTADRLKRGQLDPQARLDLHGLTEAAAHRALITFVKGAHARELRLVLIVTGKGGKQGAPEAPFDLELDMRARGILKTMTPRWLMERDLAPLVADMRTAHSRHGGDGALYVYLRKRTK